MIWYGAPGVFGLYFIGYYFRSFDHRILKVLTHRKLYSALFTGKSLVDPGKHHKLGVIKATGQ